MNPDIRRDDIRVGRQKAMLRPRSRLAYGVVMMLVTALGLLSRRFPQFVPAALGKAPGDVLWALLVFLGFGFLFPAARTGMLALAALVFSFAIEGSQLYHAPWIDAIRDTVPGRLVLGSTFLWSDLVAYTVGVFAGVVAEKGARRIHHLWHAGQ